MIENSTNVITTPFHSTFYQREPWAPASALIAGSVFFRTNMKIKSMPYATWSDIIASIEARNRHPFQCIAINMNTTKQDKQGELAFREFTKTQKNFDIKNLTGIMFLGFRRRKNSLEVYNLASFYETPIYVLPVIEFISNPIRAGLFSE